MSFKKLDPLLKNVIQELGYEAPLPFQAKVISRVKGGASLFGIAPSKCGKTTSLIINIIQKLKNSDNHDNPRALIFVKDKAAAQKLEEQFKPFRQHNDLRVYAAYDEQKIDVQKNTIYEGVDILIGTPKRLTKLYHLNGINLGELNFIAIDDAGFLTKDGNNMSEIMRISESLVKCQYVVLADSWHSKFERFQDSFMINAQVIIVEKD